MSGVSCSTLSTQRSNGPMFSGLAMKADTSSDGRKIVILRVIASLIGH
ncbi:Unknown protein sequence [Pseudomonas syringae pv. maculicola]|nr:Unknown protein sequence [Pseudomonas syringae pv. maculicola]